jgi:molybdopterin-guanine dinucleotide biosynthesis protein A
MNPSTDITGLILAGGRGTRMGSVDKGLQLLDGRPMVQHVLQRLQPQVQQVHINANQNRDTYAALGVPVWADAMPDFAGPLAGLQTGLMHCPTPWLATAPCDSPFLPANLVATLSAGLQREGAELALAVTGAGPTEQAHPVFCLASITLLSALTRYLEGGGRAMGAWFDTVHVARVHFADEAAFRNINTLEDLRQSVKIST